MYILLIQYIKSEYTFYIKAKQSEQLKETYLTGRRKIVLFIFLSFTAQQYTEPKKKRSVLEILFFLHKKNSLQKTFFLSFIFIHLTHHYAEKYLSNTCTNKRSSGQTYYLHIFMCT